jgi:hypothetical protein
MKIKNILIFGLSSYVLFLVSCSSLSVSADYDKTTDFTKIKTYSFYGWEKNSDKILNELDRDRIESSFEAEFTKRGMTLVSENGDAIVVLYIVTEEQQQTTATTVGMSGGGYGGYGGYYGYGPGWGGGMGMATTSYNTYNYTVGTLIIDVYDAKDEKLIFESSGKGTMDEKASNRAKNTPRVVSAIMKSYPIQPIKAPK